MKKESNNTKDLQQPEAKIPMDALKADLKNKSKKTKDENEKDGTIKAVPFPLTAFHPKIQVIINDLFKAFKLPKDYYGLAILTVCAGVIGNAYNLYYKRGYTVPAIIYGAIVGTSSIGKTPILKFCINPIREIEKQYHTDYKNKLAAWKKRAKDEEFTDPPPKRKDLMINDATIEAVNNAMQGNPKGLIFFLDEFVAWIKSLNQYRKGSDLENWLSIWSNSVVKVNRSSKETLFIPKPCISVVGGLQPSVLDELGSDGKKDNGFVFRILFGYPDTQHKPYETNYSPHETTFADYKNLIFGLHDLPNNIQTDDEGNEQIESISLKLSANARKRFVAWNRENTDLINETKNENVKSLYGKLESYCLRISLVLELMESVCEVKKVHSNSTLIQEQTMQNAIDLTEYFRWTGMKVMRRVEKEDPVDELTQDKREIYEALKPEFTKSDGEKIATAKGMSKRSFSRFVRNESLFERLTRGVYAKIY